MDKSVARKLQSKAVNFRSYPLLTDEIADATDMTQFAVFMESILKNLVTEEKASLVPLKTRRNLWMQTEQYKWRKNDFI